MANRTQVSLKREQLFSLIDVIESVQLKVNDDMIPVNLFGVHKQAFDEIDELDDIQRMAELTITF